MKLDKTTLQLYAITDRTWLGNKSLSEVVEEAIIGGASFIQLREKNLEDEAFLQEAIELSHLCKKYGIPFVVNDNLELALESGADGVHLGQSDLVSGIRDILGEDKILGISASNLEQALEAEKMGADYLGVGAVFPTLSKDDANYISIENLKAICEAVSIPVVAIGGINEDNVNELKGSGIAGISVISAIFSKLNIIEATKNLKTKIREIV